MKTTVSICTYRRFDVLRACIDHLLKQTVPASEFHIQVVDNSLQPEISKAFRDSLPQSRNIEYLITDRAGIAYARNVALYSCKTEYLAYTDDDAEPHADWLENLIAVMERRGPRAGAIGGRVDPIWDAPRPDWLPDELLGAVSTLNWGEEEIPITLGSGKWLISANIVYRAGVAKEVGGFSEGLGRKEGEVLAHEELDLHLRIEKGGYEVVYTPTAIVRHHVQPDRLTQEALCHLHYCEGLSRAALQEVGTLPRADIRERAKFWTQPGKVRALALFNEVTSPDAVLNKVSRIAELGLILRTLASPQFQSKPPAPPQRDLAWGHSDYTRVQPVASLPDAPGPGALSDTVYLVTPTRNCADQIDRMFKSVLAQAGDFRIRWHVQDGASTDGTVAKLESWDRAIREGSAEVACKGVEFTFASEPDSGMYDAVAKGFRRLQVPDNAFMTWLNADDRFALGAFATVQAIGQVFPSIRWITGATCILEENSVQRPVLEMAAYPREVIRAGLCDMKYWQCLQQEGTFWRGGLYRQAGGLNTELKLAGDYDLWMRFAELDELYQFKGILAYFRLRKGQMSGDLSGYVQEIERIRPLAARDLSWKELREKILERKLTFSNLQRVEDAPGFILYRFTDLTSHLPHQVYTHDDRFYHRLMVIKIKELVQRFQINTGGPAAAASSAARPAVASSAALPAQAFPAEIPAGAEAGPPAPAPGPAAPVNMPAPARGAGKVVRMLRNIKWYWLLSRSGLFHESYYLTHSPDVAAAGVDPLYHYLTCGGYEGRLPNPLFDSAYYNLKYPEVAAKGVNPLVHYVLHGAREGRDPSPHFSTRAYLEKQGGLEAVDGNPLRHYLEIGLLAPDASVPSRPAPSPSPAPPKGPEPAVSGKSGACFPEDFVYAKKSHIAKMGRAAVELFGEKLTAEACRIKQYQDLLALSFIHDRIPPGSRILDVGGGYSRVLKFLSRDYECWNVDKLEGLGNGPTNMEKIKAQGYRLVRAYMGDFTPELPNDYFDFVFSISALEHTPENQPETYERILRDIQRVAKDGAWSLHLFDILVRDSGFWMSDCMKAFFRLAKPGYELPDEKKILSDPDLFVMGREEYDSCWKEVIKKPYDQFGRPTNATVLWQVKK